MEATKPIAVPAAPAAVEKLGAGLLICCGTKALVLLRNSAHNHNTWGLPGGNADPEDRGDLFATATREAIEEMTTIPPLELRGEVLTQRGKRGQKHYHVFVCSVTEEQRVAYTPALNYEHSRYEWFELSELRRRPDLHPVVNILVREHWGALWNFLGMGDAAGL